MARNFDSSNKDGARKRLNMRIAYKTKAFGPHTLGVGDPVIRNNHWVESIHYGVIDHLNNSVIPDERYLVETATGRVFDFVADSYSLMRLNWGTALQRGLVSAEGSAFGNLEMVRSYTDPKKKYQKYLGNILDNFNKKYIPKHIGIDNITSHEQYVNAFFKFILKDRAQAPITMTKWNTTRASNILDTGLAFSYSDIPMDDDKRKVNEIIDHSAFIYFSNLCMNMGFSIAKENPNILICELKSPANDSIRFSYGLFTLSNVFNNRFIKTHTIDNMLLYNNINIYYNKFVQTNPHTRVVYQLDCGETTSHYVTRSVVPLTTKPFTDLQELDLYCKMRNVEEGRPHDLAKMKEIYRKAKNFLKKVDKAEAISYINREFRDQVWNKDHGYHDLKKKLMGESQSQQQNNTSSGANPSRGQSGAGSSGGGSSSY